MAINPNADFNQLTTWLNQNLAEENSITPHSDSIPRISSKGIYFWFMHPDGYKALSNFVAIEPITPRYTKEINGVKYDLVYLGTSGTGKEGNSNLTKRLDWHINQQHSTSSVISGALSTLRQGLGSLLADDLIIPNTENLINTFMKKYTLVFWIEYPDNKQLIDSDEDLLIIEIRPLLNLKNNPNKTIFGNSTIIYKLRRGIVVKSSKSRIENNSNNINTTTKMKTNQEPILANNSMTVNNGCVEFKVNVNQSVADIADALANLPVGPCTIEIINPQNGQNVYVQNNGNPLRTIRTIGRTVCAYFEAVDAQGPPKAQVVQNEMIHNGIQEIIVRVCPK